MSLQEDSLRNSTVLNSRFEDVEGVVIEVIVDCALSKSEVLIWVFNHMLLEVAIEPEHLSVMLEPLRRLFWDGLVDSFLSLRDSSHLQRLSELHAVEEVLINVLFDCCCPF